MNRTTDRTTMVRSMEAMVRRMRFPVSHNDIMAEAMTVATIADIPVDGAGPGLLDAFGKPMRKQIGRTRCAKESAVLV